VLSADNLTGKKFPTLSQRPINETPLSAKSITAASSTLPVILQTTGAAAAFIRPNHGVSSSDVTE